MKKKLDKNITEEVIKGYSQRYKQLFEYNFYAGGDIIDEADDDQSQQTEIPIDAAPQSELPQEELPQPDYAISGDITQPSMEGGVEEFEDINVDSDDNFVDITDLTDAQEETSNEVAQLDSKFDQFNQFAEKLTQALEKIVQKAEENENEIQAVKDEIIKRAPTNTEKLNIRVLDSQPYNQPIADFWKNKAETNPNYDIKADNSSIKSDEKEYVLYDTDGDNVSDQEIFNSFNNNLRNLVGI